MIGPRYILATVAGLLLAAAGAGCPQVKPVMLDKKTQLENQILGTFQRLEQDLVLASSVRGAAPASKLSPLQREAVEAMMSREFNRDDIDELKQARIVGEANTGMLKLLAPPKEPALAKRVTALVEEENDNRMVIIRRAIQLNSDLTNRDLPAVQRTFYRLNVQTAKSGDRVQLENGRWEDVLRKGGGGAR